MSAKKRENICVHFMYHNKNSLPGNKISFTCVPEGSIFICQFAYLPDELNCILVGLY